jgi:transcriptional regulator with XRE-family HTH domain
MTFGELLTKTRMRLAVTQEGLAVLSMINVGRIDAFENGRIIPKRNELHAIIRSLQLDEIDGYNLFDWRSKALSKRHQDDK